MRAVAWAVVGLVVAFPHATDAGKTKKHHRRAEAFTLAAHDAHTTKAGVELALEERGHGQRADGRELATWVLVASEGDERHEAYFTNEEPWAELVAFDTVYQATPADGGVHVKVIPGAATELDDAVIEQKVTAAADKARIAYSGIGRATMAGVSRVVLGGDGFWVVEARVGQFTGAVLDYRVDPYAKVEPALPKGALVGRLTAGAEVEVGGLNVSAVEGGLSVRKGKKVKPAPAGLAEVVMFARVLWVRGDELVVTPSKRIRPRRKAISTSKAIDLVQDEADRRDIAYDRASATSTLSSGVVEVTLALGDETTVSAAVGAHTKKFLRYDVTRPGMGTAAPDPDPDPDPQPDPKPDPVTAADPSAAMATILAEHNRYRADHCAPALTWSDELAATAQAWAETLQNARCAFEHSKSKYGENLAAGSTGWLSPEEVVGMWYREVDEYDFKSGGFSMSTGHFTQLVWKKTKRVGCGMVSDCEGMDIWVCNYDPPGNYTDQYDENVLPTGCEDLR